MHAAMPPTNLRADQRTVHHLTLLEVRFLKIAQQIILLMLEMTFGTVTSEMLSEKRASKMAVKKER